MRASLLSACLLALLCTHAYGAKIYEQPGFQALPAESGRIILSRGPNAPTACDVAILVGGIQGAELSLGDSVTFDVGAGELPIIMMTTPAGYCGSLNLRNSQSILINAGETREFQIEVTTDSIFIAPAGE